MMIFSGCDASLPSRGDSGSHDRDGAATATFTTVKLGDSAPAASLPAGCSPDEVATVMHQFLDAFNHGDQQALRAYFKPQDPAHWSQAAYEKEFQVFGVGKTEQTPEFVASDLPALFEYFAQRHAHGEKLALLSLEVNESWAPDRVELAFNLTRVADDVPLHALVAKGALVCSTHQFVVWQMQG
jgi:hypothetical protein